MKTYKVLYLIIFAVFLTNNLNAQNGYYDAPYIRYEADLGVLNNATATTRSYAQGNLQSEASEQVCVNLSNVGASVTWTVSGAGDGLVVRYSVPDGQSGVLEVFANNVSVGTLTLSSNWSWEYLSSDANPNNVDVTNTNPKMRFDEVRMKLPSKIPAGGSLKLVRQSGNIHIDFAELESIPAAIGWSSGNVTYSGDGSTLQTFINNNGGKTIYLPAGFYNVNRELYFGANDTKLKGAGMWHTQIHFTNGNGGQGGLRANAYGIGYSGLYLTTVRNSRSGSYKAINGVYTGVSTITDVWAEHFECGAWIGQYNTGGPSVADGFTVSGCRFRNNYADGINLCKGTKNTIVEHCSFRNNGDDDMAIWSANGQECQYNTFRYNTSENCWRSSGCAIYGGLSNKAHNLLIQDNVEVGIKVNNAFGGAPFNAGGMHEIYNISIKRCGTYHDLFHRPVGAIELGCYDWGAGTQVRNVKFSCIDITDSKNDAIYIHKSSGDGFYNLVFENITINGTGREYPDNGGAVAGRGHMILFKGSPAGNSTYCGMNYSNRGGSATVDVNTTAKGSLSWTQAGTCPGGCVLPNTSSTSITSSATFGVCNNPVTLTATTTVPSGNTVSNIDFFVDNVSIGKDNTSPYSIDWSNPSIGNYQVKAVATYSGGTTSTSPIQNMTVADGIYTTGTAPVIDGTIDAVWNNYAAFSLNKVSVGSISGASDLSATYKIARDATNLYILVNVTDDILRNDGTANWQKDAVEIFIDMGNDKSTSYVANNDYQYTFVYNVSTAQAGITFAQGAKTGGYIMEIRIPWATLGGAQAAGTFMGFDLHVNDNDSGDRDAKIAWNDQTDKAWQNPSVLGTLQIAGCTAPVITTTPVADFTSNPASACIEQTVTFTDASINTPVSWSWYFGAGATPETATTKGPHNVVYSTAGAKTVSLTASNSAGYNSVSKSIVIITVADQPGTISGPTLIASGSTHTYSISPVAGAATYTWTLPGGWTGSSTSTNISATAGSTGGNVSVSATNACGTSVAASVAVSIGTAPSAPEPVSGPSVVDQGQNNVSYTAPLVSGVTYTWSYVGGTGATFNGTGNSVTVDFGAGATSGNISVTATNSFGTSSAGTISITVNPSVISGLNNQVVSYQLQVYPNPAASFATVKINTWNSGDFDIAVFDMLGTQVKVLLKNEPLINNSYIFSVDELAAGVYWVRARSGIDNQIVKFIKQ